MMGGGYVVSGDVAASLVNINKHMRLKFTPIEDATLGFWLMSMDLRHIDHPRCSADLMPLHYLRLSTQQGCDLCGML